MVFEISDVLSTLFNKLKELRVLTDLKFLHVCQSFRRILMADQPANYSDKIISSCRAKVDRLTVPIDERRHIIPFIDISPIAHNLTVLFGS